MASPVIIRGGGDLASGVAVRLYRAGMRVVIAELEKPLAVRRTVAFAEAIYAGKIEIEGIVGRRIKHPSELLDVLDAREVPVLVDPELYALATLSVAHVDARMTKQPPDIALSAVPLLIGLGPGFVAGKNCHALVETLRGHNLGRVFWEGSAAADTGKPGSLGTRELDRVLHAPDSGYLEYGAEIGQHLRKGDLIGRVGGKEILAQFHGVLRGLIHPSVELTPGMKIGDLDPRNDPSYCRRVSDKALAVGGGVLEALLVRAEIRDQLWA